MQEFSMRNKIRRGNYVGEIETRQKGHPRNHYISIIIIEREGEHDTTNLQTVTYSSQEQAEEGHRKQLEILRKKLENLVNN